MPYVLNGETLAYGQPFTVGDVQYSGVELGLWSRADLEALGLTWVEPETVVETVEQRLAALADYRWTKTQAMPSYDGATDVPADTARSVVTSKVLAAQFMTEEQKLERHAFKLKPGEWRDWNLPDLIGYGLAIGVYMQLCFDREAALEAEIIAAYPAPVDITTGWPS
jgi:hypothetical protein